MERVGTRQHQRCRPSVAGAVHAGAAAQSTTVGGSQRRHCLHQTSYYRANRTTRGMRTAVNILPLSLQGPPRTCRRSSVLPPSPACPICPRTPPPHLSSPHLTPTNTKLPNETNAMGSLSFAARETTRPSRNMLSRSPHAMDHAKHRSPPNTLSKIVPLCRLAAVLCTPTHRHSRRFKTLQDASRHFTTLQDTSRHLRRSRHSRHSTHSAR